MKNKVLYILVLVLLVGIIGYMAYGYYEKEKFELKNPIVTMEIENFGTVKMELYPEMAPNTVRNFIALINEGYYDGLTFHRVEESLIQGGDKEGTGSGQTDYTIPGEFKINGHKNNTLSFERGTLGLARADYTIYYYYTGNKDYLELGYNSGYAQFFIMAQDMTDFDGSYCAFGKVIEGMEIVDEITKLETKQEKNEETGEMEKTSEPVNKPVITKMTVDTFGVQYKEPTRYKVEKSED